MKFMSNWKASTLCLPLAIISLTLPICSPILAADDKAEAEDKPATIEDKVASLEKSDGYIPFYFDSKKGKILVEVSRWNQDFLYVHSLATGLGSNPVGLDRGQLGSERVVQFQRVGPKVLLVQRNLRFRADTDNALERRAVEQSFAQSVLWGGEVIAESDSGNVLVDLTGLLLSDTHGVIQTLSNADQGSFSLDAKRSAVYLPNCKSFPKNTEFEATLTFAGSKPGRYVRQTTPTPESITLRQHHSFIELPDSDYHPRKYDVRSPSIFVTFADYAAGLDEPLQKRWITRHRLKKRDPAAAMSAPVEPIIYYVDAGAPKQIQDALMEGASWWNEAFEAAGFENAFQVRLLPADADPLDVRYNVIQWVHRSTRGWSYGSSIIDPRTGEILKGHVTLGSLRVRQDQVLFKGLQQTPANISCACCGVVGVDDDTTLAQLDKSTSALEVALARIRQLSAHEVGHTLGFVHNFAASTYGDRASVMDYPAPRVRFANDGSLDLSDAYGVGIGEWDKVAVKFAYQEFLKDESSELESILSGAAKDKMLFISDADARPAGAVHPLANLWDNGSDPIEELKHLMKVRKYAIDRFDVTSLPSGATSADIAEYFTPLFLHHRYQLQAVGKMIGGFEYQYGLAAEANSMTPVGPEKQTEAMNELLKTIAPSALSIPQHIVLATSPKPYSAIRDAEIVPSQMGRVFDPLAAARVATDLTLNELLQHERVARLGMQTVAAIEAPEAAYVRSLAIKIWNNRDPDLPAISQVTLEAFIEKLAALADNSSASGRVRSAAQDGLLLIANRIANTDSAMARMLSRRIKQIMERPMSPPKTPATLDTPPGSPIGN